MMHGSDTDETEAAPGPARECTDAEGAVDPAALPILQAARLLGIGEDALRGDIDAGAPVNADGTIHLVHYAAWVCLMLRNESRRNSDAETPC